MAAVYVSICIPRYIQEKNCPPALESKEESTRCVNSSKKIITSHDIISVKTQVLSNDESSTLAEKMENISLHKALKSTLKRMDIENITWSLSHYGMVYQISFICKAEILDKLLNELDHLAIGCSHGSCISIVPCIIHKKRKPKYSSISTLEDLSVKDILLKKSQFVKSIKARLTVAQVSEVVTQMATINFDFVIWIFVASMLAAIGLAENSSILIGASMIVCPLMGPIMSGSFGILLGDKKLTNLALKTEFLGFSFCLIYGFIFSLSFGYIGEYFSGEPWPTYEMYSRGTIHSLWIGLITALLCGAACALATLGANMPSWIGVAISASLLPPSVNTGMLWAYSLILKMHSFSVFRSHGNYSGNSTSRKIVDNFLSKKNYIPTYTKYRITEYGLLGIVSLLLSIENVLGILATGIIMLKIKEIAPIKSVMPSASFWREDIKIARDYNKKCPSESGESIESVENKTLGVQLMEEWMSINDLDLSNLDGKEHEEEKIVEVVQSFIDIIEDVENDDTYKKVIGTIPGKSIPKSLTQHLTMQLLETQDKDVVPPSPSLKRVYNAIKMTPSLQRCKHRFSQRSSKSEIFYSINNSEFKQTPSTNSLRHRRSSGPENLKDFYKLNLEKQNLSAGTSVSNEKNKNKTETKDCCINIEKNIAVNPLIRYWKIAELKRSESFKTRPAISANCHKCIRRTISAEPSKVIDKVVDKKDIALSQEPNVKQKCIDTNKLLK